jgi:hypothetical protein
MEHFAHGYVFSLPNLFLMFRPAQYLREGITYDEPHNCWYVTVAATKEGEASVTDLLKFMPYPLPLVAWMRRGQERVRVFSTEKILRKAGIWERAKHHHRETTTERPQTH